jgi:hypothetical protein
MKLLQSALARLSTPANRTPVSQPQPQRLEASSLKQVSGGLPRIGGLLVPEDSLLLPRIGGL